MLSVAFANNQMLQRGPIDSGGKSTNKTNVISAVGMCEERKKQKKKNEIDGDEMAVVGKEEGHGGMQWMH